MRYCGGCGLRLLNASTDTTNNLPTEPEISNKFGALIGSDLLDRFKAAGLQATGQKRLVTILFVDLSGFTNLSEGIDTEELYEIVQNCSKIFANAVYRYDGMVDKFTGDGLMALFGAPIAHENNAELAIRAALDMQADLKEFSNSVSSKIGQELTAHIGLNSGSVIVGGIGSNMMMNYTAIGDVVNQASRIMNAATSNVILVSERIYRQARGLFECEEMEPLTLKGVSHQVQTYKILSIRNIAGAHHVLDGLYSPMIGRDGELDRVQQNITQMMIEKNGRFIAIMGEAGIGKSRLVSELKDQLNNLPLTIVEGNSFIYRKAISYWLLQNMLLRHIDVDPNTAPNLISTRLAEKIERVLPGRGREGLPYLEYMLAIPYSDPIRSKFIDFLPADQLRSQIFRWLKDIFVEESKKTPVVIILEDLHWSDNGSLEFLKYFLGHINKEQIIIIALSRTFSQPELTEINTKASELLKVRFSEIHLSNLSNDQVDQLLGKLSNISNFPEDLRNEIVQRSTGIPLYVEEMIRMLKDQNMIFKVDGHWSLKDKVDIKSLGNSDTLEGLILTRFDNLDPITRHILKTSSVIGSTFTSALLTLCLPKLLPDEIKHSLENLIQKGFIHPDPSPGGEFQFKNLLISDTIYSTQLKRDRKDLHGVVALAIETLFSANLSNQTDILARHFFWSDFNEKALYYQILAGQKAYLRFNTSQANEYFTNGLSLLEYTDHDTKQALSIYEGLGDSGVFIGNYEDARNYFENGLDLCQKVGIEFASSSACLQRKIGSIYDRLGDIDKAISYLAEAKKSLNGTNDLTEMAQILNDEGWIDFRRGRMDEAEKSLLVAEELSTEINNLEISSAIYNRMGGLYYEKNMLDKAEEYSIKSLKIREEIGDIRGLARSHNNIALLEWKQGKWTEAYNNFLKSAEIQKKLSDTEAIIELNCNIGLLQLDRGNIHEAIESILSSKNQAEEIGHKSHTAVATLYLGRAYITLEDWSNALHHATTAKELFEEIDDPEYSMDVLFDLANIYIHLNRLGQAKINLDSAQEIFDGLEPDLQFNNKGKLLSTTAEFDLSMGNYELAILNFNASAEAYSEIHYQLELGKVFSSLSKLYKRMDDEHNSSKYRLAASEIFSALGSTFELEKLSSKSN
jgi:predicted ATPase/class 3 adenylate cyclase